MNTSFGKANYLIIALGVCLGIWGMYLLSLAPVNNKISLNVAPFVLALAYLVVIPAGILYPSKNAQKSEKTSGQPSKS
jgi:ABC-type antimicrobial peptide transport system permease subunit